MAIKSKTCSRHTTRLSVIRKFWRGYKVQSPTISMIKEDIDEHSILRKVILNKVDFTDQNSRQYLCCWNFMRAGYNNYHTSIHTKPCAICSYEHYVAKSLQQFCKVSINHPHFMGEKSEAEKG